MHVVLRADAPHYQGGTTMATAAVEKFYVVLEGELEVRTAGPR